MGQAQYCTFSLQSGTYDDNEVLMSSFLIKRPTLSTSSLNEQSEATFNHHMHHANIKWKPSHRYWCVLRRSQFSYYKDETERKPERVISMSDVLNCRVYEDTKMDLYTRDKTLRFEADDSTWAQMWVRAFKLLIHGDEDHPGSDSPPGGIKSPVFEGHYSNPSPEKQVPQLSRAGYGDNEDYDDEDDEFDVVYETDVEGPRNQALTNSASKPSTCTGSMDNRKISEEDKQFYEAYDPSNSEKLIQSGLLYGQVKHSILRKKWKPFKGELTNRQLRLVSLTTDRVYAIIDLNDVVDCVELDKNDPCFALIVISRRLKFKAKNDDEMIDWIINIKSSVLVREKISHKSL